MEFYNALHIVSVIITFDPTAYTVTEGVDSDTNLLIRRSGDLTRTVVVTVTTTEGTATGMTHNSVLFATIGDSDTTNERTVLLSVVKVAVK